MPMSRTFSILVFAATAMFFGCFLLWPILITVRGAFFDVEGHLTFDYVAEVFGNRIYLDGLRNAFFLALATPTDSSFPERSCSLR